MSIVHSRQTTSRRNKHSGQVDRSGIPLERKDVFRSVLASPFQVEWLAIH